MLRTIVRVGLAALALLAPVPIAAQEPALEELLARHYAAIGGLERWKAVGSLRLTGTMTAGPIRAPFVLVTKRPAKSRLDFMVRGRAGVQAFDGETAWIVMPVEGDGAPQRMPEEQAREMREQSDFDGPLVDNRAKGHSIELLGQDTIDGTPVHVLRVRLGSGEVRTYSIDAEHWLPIRVNGTRNVRGSEVAFLTTFGDYREVEGLVIPHSISSVLQGTPAAQTLTVERVEVNVELPDSLFTMPSGS